MEFFIMCISTDNIYSKHKEDIKIISCDLTKYKKGDLYYDVTVDISWEN